jgi:hypothetical protein
MDIDIFLDSISKTPLQSELPNLTHLEIDNSTLTAFDVLPLPSLTHLLVYYQYTPFANIVPQSFLVELDRQLAGLPSSVIQFAWVFEVGSEDNNLLPREDLEVVRNMKNPDVVLGIFRGVGLPDDKVFTNPFPEVIFDDAKDYYAQPLANVRPKKKDVWAAVEGVLRRRSTIMADLH